jgi:outer membrane protein OmpA-like peptidoglycan-associated protein
VRPIERLGYPARAVVMFAAALALAVLWLVLPVGRGWAWSSTAVILLALAVAVAWLTRRLARARERSAAVLAALGAATTDVPLDLRRRMPLVLVTGDALAALFDRHPGEGRLVFVGDGAIWLRADRPQDLPQLALAMRQWRDGRPPDGVVLCVAPALHADADALAQSLRVARQARADASRMVGRRMPGHVAVYQRLTNAPHRNPSLAPPSWHGVSAAAPLTDADRFEAVIRRAESEAQRLAAQPHEAHDSHDPHAAARAAALASIVGWTQRVVFGALTDPRQPAAPWPLFGAGWIDCGPASGPDKPWERDVRLHARVAPPEVSATPQPWPLPQPLIEAAPRRIAPSPRRVALAHSAALAALAGAVAFWGAGKNNEALLARVGAHLERYAATPAAHDAARRDALRSLVADRDELDRYARTGVPLRLSFGLYRGASLIPALDGAIAAYEPPPPAPAVVTLDSMSLFDSGEARLKPGSTRALVGALEMIKANPDKRILIAGHTDDAGDAPSNLRLSLARASALRDWLIDASGIAPTRFAIQGYGDTRPVAGNDTPAGRAKNRRVEITLVPDTQTRR